MHGGEGAQMTSKDKAVPAQGTQADADEKGVPASPPLRNREGPLSSKATNPEEHARGCEYDGATWKCASRCPVRAAMIAPTQTAEQYTQLLRELDDLLDFLAKEVITLDIVESDKNNGQWPRSDLVKHAREDIAKALQAPTDTERPKCPCGAWYWDEHTMACAIRVSAVATAPAVEKAKYRIRLLEDDNLLLRSRIAEACLHCSPGSVVWEILNPREESRPAYQEGQDHMYNEIYEWLLKQDGFIAEQMRRTFHAPDASKGEER
jgi:hypothetical protein